MLNPHIQGDFELKRLSSRNGNKQIVFYQSGVGSESNFQGDLVTGTTAIRTLRFPGLVN